MCYSRTIISLRCVFIACLLSSVANVCMILARMYTCSSCFRYSPTFTEFVYIKLGMPQLQEKTYGNFPAWMETLEVLRLETLETPVLVWNDVKRMELKKVRSSNKVTFLHLYCELELKDHENTQYCCV
jgi:hypothetical protein